MSRRPYNPWGTPDEPPDDAERDDDASPLVTRLRSLAARERAAVARDGEPVERGWLELLQVPHPPL